MPADQAKTMAGEHPIAAIKRLAHWEVEDDIGMLRTRLACISAQADKVTAAPPKAAPTREQVTLHEQYVVDHGSDHDENCPGDDTCTCSMRPRNEAVNAVCRYLAAPPMPARCECDYASGARRAAPEAPPASDCRAAVRAALLELSRPLVDTAAQLGSGPHQRGAYLAYCHALRILDAKLAALEDAP